MSSKGAGSSEAEISPLPPPPHPLRRWKIPLQRVHIKKTPRQQYGGEGAEKIVRRKNTTQRR